MKLFILADDLTGALDTGALLSETGCRVSVYSDWKAPVPDAEIVTCNVNSRHLPPEEAFRRTAYVLKNAAAKAERIYIKVDSALRGNVSASLRAAKDVFGEPVMFVPAFPQAGRTTAGGIHYVDGVPLSKSPYSRDPLEPSGENSVVNIISRDFPCNTVLTPLPPSFSSSWQPADVILFDCRTEEELSAIAALLRQTGQGKVAAGSAGFIKSYAESFLPAGRPAPKKEIFSPVLVVSGSLHARTRRQIELAEKTLPVFHVTAENLLSGPGALTDAARSAAECLCQGQSAVVSSRFQALPGSVDKKNASAAAEAFGNLAGEILKDCPAAALYLIGGDTAQAVLNRLEIPVLSPRWLWEPGIPVSECRWKNGELTVITKSGGLGSDENIADIINFAKRSEKI